MVKATVSEPRIPRLQPWGVSKIDSSLFPKQAKIRGNLPKNQGFYQESRRFLSKSGLPQQHFILKKQRIFSFFLIQTKLIG